MEVENYDNETVKNELGEVLDSFSENLYQPLPELPKQGFTQLDRLTREHRSQEWKALREDCDLLRREMTIRPLLEMVVEVEEYIGRLKSMAYEVGLLRTRCGVTFISFEQSLGGGGGGGGELLTWFQHHSVKMCSFIKNIWRNTNYTLYYITGQNLNLIYEGNL